MSNREDRGPGTRERRSSERELRDAALHAARAVHDRARFQHNQVTRLRRRRFEVIPIPFMWEPELELDAVERIAERLASRL